MSSGSKHNQTDTEDLEGSNDQLFFLCQIPENDIVIASYIDFKSNGLWLLGVGNIFWGKLIMASVHYTYFPQHSTRLQEQKKNNVKIRICRSYKQVIDNF